MTRLLAKHLSSDTATTMGILRPTNPGETSETGPQREPPIVEELTKESSNSSETMATLDRFSGLQPGFKHKPTTDREQHAQQRGPRREPVAEGQSAKLMGTRIVAWGHGGSAARGSRRIQEAPKIWWAAVLWCAEVPARRCL